MAIITQRSNHGFLDAELKQLLDGPCQIGQEEPKEPEPWFHCERHGRFYGVKSCLTCDALKQQEQLLKERCGY